MTARTIAFLENQYFQGSQPIGIKDFCDTLQVRTNGGAIAGIVRATDPEYGATGNGTTDDTVALNAAASAIPSVGGVLIIPPGTYLHSATIMLKSNTTVIAFGATFAASAAWPAPPGGSTVLTTTGYCTFENVNFGVAFNATTKTDHDITILGGIFDATALVGAIGENGAQHCIRMRMVQTVRVQFSRFISWSDATAFLACDDTLVESCRSTGSWNTAYDHWEGPTNSKVINNVAVCQFVTQAGGASNGIGWTSTDSAATGTMNADGCLIAGNKISGMYGPAIGISTLNAAGGNCFRARIVNNIIDGGGTSPLGIALYDAGGYHVVEGNYIINLNGSGGAGSGQPILVAPLVAAVGPSNCRIVGNHILNCSVPSGSLGVIAIDGPNVQVVGNTILGGTRAAGDVWTIGNNGFYDQNISDVAFTATLGIKAGNLGTGNIVNGSDITNGIMYHTGPTELATIGFNNTTPIARPTVSGAKGGNAALTSLMTTLANLGLVTDGTS